MPEYPKVDLPKQTALWMSSSKQEHIIIYKMQDRHLLGAIGNTQNYAKWKFEETPNKPWDSKWWDYLPMAVYIPLVKECVRRFLDVPGEEDMLRLMELVNMENPKQLNCCCKCMYRIEDYCMNKESKHFDTIMMCPENCDKWDTRV